MTSAPLQHWIAADPAIQQALAARSALWLVTGGAGFIGSHLLEALLLAGQRVRVLDNFSTGYRHNLDEVRARVGEGRWHDCTVLEADIRDREAAHAAVEGVDYVLHQAALGSVPRSLADPLTTHDVNCTGFLNILEAARRAGVENFVYAASSSTYGDEPNLPKVEDQIGNPLSPYAVTKYVNEVYANVYATAYGMAPIGLRYFNVFGPRQDPAGAYAAVIPLWVAAMLKGEAVTIYGDGETSRDFCYVANVVQANLRAALAPSASKGQVYNVAVGERTTLNSLFRLLRGGLEAEGRSYTLDPAFRDFRAGDVRHSLADIGKARRLLGYVPTHATAAGLTEALPWYIQHC